MPACILSHSFVSNSSEPHRLVAHQAPLGFPRQECWSGLPHFLFQGIFLIPGVKPMSLASAGRFFIYHVGSPIRTLRLHLGPIWVIQHKLPISRFVSNHSSKVFLLYTITFTGSASGTWNLWRYYSAHPGGPNEEKGPVEVRRHAKM